MQQSLAHEAISDHEIRVKLRVSYQLSHRIHGTGISTFICLIFTPKSLEVFCYWLSKLAPNFFKTSQLQKEAMLVAIDFFSHKH